jgi:predicted HicB family RNase H-like nuclease
MNTPTHGFFVRCSPEQYEAIAAQAERDGQSPDEWFRGAASEVLDLFEGIASEPTGPDDPSLN